MISVIIPIYNVEAYIERCLKSVISQSYKDVEIILVDDCGSDKSMDIAKSLMSSMSNVDYRIESHQRNCGLSAARNTGLNIAKGDFVYFLDSDDWLPEDALIELVQAAETYKAFCIVGEYSNNTDVKGKFLEIPYKYGEYKNLTNRDEIVSFFTNKNLPITAWNKLIKRNFLLENKLYFEKGIYHEDALWTLQVVSVLPSLCLVPKVTYCYAYSPNSIMNNHDDEKMQKRFESSLIVLKKMKESVEKIEIEGLKRMMMVYVGETKYYMYRKLLIDGMSKTLFKRFYELTHSKESLSDWFLLSAKLKVGHLDMLFPAFIGYYYFMFLYRCVYKK